jgi:hypothetical protein
VVLRDVQGAEVVVVGLDFRPLRDPVAEAGKDIDNLLDRALQGMAVAGGHVAAARRHIDPFPLQPFGHGGVAHGLEPGAEQFLHLLLEAIGPLAHQGTLLTGETSHGPEHSGEPPFLAQQPQPQLLEGGGVAGVGDGGGGLRLQVLQLVSELLQADGGAHGTDRGRKRL